MTLRFPGASAGGPRSAAPTIAAPCRAGCCRAIEAAGDDGKEIVRARAAWAVAG
jgi:hypothetical protein